MDESLGAVLEKSLNRDIPRSLRGESVANKVVSPPAAKPKPPVVKEIIVPSSNKPEPTKKVLAVEAIPEQTKDQDVEAERVNNNAIRHLLLLRHFGLDSNPSHQEIEKLKTIWEYIKVTHNVNSPDDIVRRAINLRNKLGMPRFDEAILDRVYRFAQIRLIQHNEKHSLNGRAI